MRTLTYDPGPSVKPTMIKFGDYIRRRGDLCIHEDTSFDMGFGGISYHLYKRNMPSLYFFCEMPLLHYLIIHEYIGTIENNSWDIHYLSFRPTPLLTTNGEKFIYDMLREFSKLYGSSFEIRKDF